MRKFLNFFLLLLITLFVFSCKGDDDIVDPEPTVSPYEKGVLILNEGLFQSGVGTISHYDKTTKTVSQNIFQQENDGTVLGNLAQSMYAHNGFVYIVVNNSNTVEVVNAKTFKSEGTITGLEQPRYFVPIDNNRAFVSQWGADKITGSVAVVNLGTLEIEKTISTGVGTEHMLIANNKLYAANKGFTVYDSEYNATPYPDSTLAVIDLDNLELLEKVTVGYNPSHLELDKNGDIWVLCIGDWTLTELQGSITIVDDNQVKEQIPLFTGIDDLCTNSDGSTMYYTNYNQLLSIDVDDAAHSSNLLLQQNIYNVAVEPSTNNIYVADAKDYVSNGTVYIYDDKANLTDSIVAGIIPSGFWFLD